MRFNRIDGRVVLYHEAVDFWEQEIEPDIEQLFPGNDIPAKRESWNNYVDALHKNDQISGWQCHNWSNPV